MNLDVLIFVVAPPLGLMGVVLVRAFVQPSLGRNIAVIFLFAAVAAAALYVVGLTLEGGYATEPMVTLGPPLALSVPLTVSGLARRHPVASAFSVVASYLAGVAVALYLLLKLGYVWI